MNKEANNKMKISKKTKQIGETVQTEFKFSPKAQQYVLNTFPLSTEAELTAITDLITSEPDWVHASLKNKLKWIADEIVAQTLLAYAVQDVGVKDTESLLASVDYDGHDITIVIGQFSADIQELQAKKKPKKPCVDKDNKVVDLNGYRKNPALIKITKWLT